MAPELKGLVLNACRTEQMARRIHSSLPHLAIVCWSSVVHDGAAKTFSSGFFKAFADGAPGATSVSTAFDAGRAAFLRAGYCEGDPEAYLHPPGHEHRCVKFPQWRSCPGCNPPVHGSPCLVNNANKAKQAAAAAAAAEVRRAEERRAEREAAAKAAAEKKAAAEAAATATIRAHLNRGVAKPDDEAVKERSLERGRGPRERRRKEQYERHRGD